MRNAIIFSILLTLFGCAHQPRIAHTSSGNPEVIIQNVDKETIRNHIIDNALSHNMSLDSESSSRIVVSQEVTGFKESMLRMALANSYSTPVRAEIAFTLVKIPEGVKVFSQSSAWSQMPSGQIKRMAINSNEDFNAMQKALYRLRDDFK